jgi:hypothetical protein
MFKVLVIQATNNLPDERASAVSGCDTLSFVSGELSKTAIRPGGTGHEIRTLGL